MSSTSSTIDTYLFTIFLLAFSMHVALVDARILHERMCHGLILEGKNTFLVRIATKKLLQTTDTKDPSSNNNRRSFDSLSYFV